jgi:FkbM family methyltransferase
MAPKSVTASAKDAMKVTLTRYPKAYDSLRRPYSAARFLMRRPHDLDYGLFGLFRENRGVFLDVGANAGMSALSFRVYNKVSPIVSVEPNPFHERDLRFTARLVKPFTYRMWAAGRTDGTMALHVPVYRNVPLTTEASLILEEVTASSSLRARLGARMDSPDFKIIRCEVLVKPLDCLGLDPAFVKLDVQGFEYDALLGLKETIDRARPILLVETPDDEVREVLDALGYKAFSYVPTERTLEPEVGGKTNTVFLPNR